MVTATDRQLPRSCWRMNSSYHCTQNRIRIFLTEKIVLSFFSVYICLLFRSIMVNICSIKICRNVTGKNTFRAHKFPADRKVADQWLSCIKEMQPSYECTKTAVICSAHFVDSDYVISGNAKSLNKNAVPSIFQMTVRRSLLKILHDLPVDKPLTSTITDTNDTILNETGIDLIIEQSSMNDEPMNTYRVTSVENKRKHKNVVGDFEETDLECPRDRIKYWHISQKTYKTLKIQNRILRSQNMAMMREIKSFQQLTNHLKNENTIADHCYSVLHRAIC